MVARSPQIRRGNYDIITIVNHIELQFKLAFKNNIINLKFNRDEYQVELIPNVKFAIAFYAERSVLKVLIFGFESTLRNIPGKRDVEFMIFDENKGLTAKLSSSLKRISNMFVYSDIVELSYVGNNQVQLIGFFPIKSDFMDNGHWVFNPPLYVRVKETNINTITMKISIEI